MKKSKETRHYWVKLPELGNWQPRPEVIGKQTTGHPTEATILFLPLSHSLSFSSACMYAGTARDHNRHFERRKIRGNDRGRCERPYPSSMHTYAYVSFKWCIIVNNRCSDAVFNPWSIAGSIPADMLRECNFSIVFGLRFSWMKRLLLWILVSYWRGVCCQCRLFFPRIRHFIPVPVLYIIKLNQSPFSIHISILI